MRFVWGFHFSYWLSNYIIDDAVNELESDFLFHSTLLYFDLFFTLCLRHHKIRVSLDNFGAHSTLALVLLIWNPTSTGHRQIMQLNICIWATCIKYLRFQQKPACRNCQICNRHSYRCRAHSVRLLFRWEQQKYI